MTRVLEQARAMDYAIGSNPKGRRTGAAWILLLPSLEPGTILILGRIDQTERDALERLPARMVDVADDRAATTFAREGTRDPDGSGIGLVRVGGGGAALVERTPGLRDAVEQGLAAGASLYMETVGLPHRTSPWLSFADGAATELRLTPPFGGARVITVADDEPARRRLRELGHLPAAGGSGRAGRLAGRLLARTGLQDRLVERRGVLTVTGRADTDGPPEYIANIARAAGRPIDGMRWALVAPGDYATQKVLLYLLDPISHEPSTVVKLGTDPAHLPRLQNEARALMAVARLGMEPGHVPELRFAGDHAGLGVLGEQWVRGRPFRSAAERAPGWAQLEAATSWLEALASRTVTRVEAQDVAEALRDLLGRFRATFALPADEMAFLAARVGIVGRHGGRLPTVLQHGDPGVWNLLVDDAGRVVFLDWESAEAHGLPIWDLLYLQRSFGSMTSRREGIDRRLDAALRHLMAPTALQARFVADLRRAASAVSLPTELIEPMFYACWMHRALKEATRRTPASLHGGHYLRMLRVLIARRDEPTLDALVASERPR